MLNLVLSLLSIGSASRFIHRVRSLKRVQDDSPRNFEYLWHLTFILKIKGIGCIDSQKDNDYDIGRC